MSQSKGRGRHNSGEGRQQPQADTVPTHPALLWCRGVGLGSICVGGIGLVTAYFWWSIGFVYAGLLLLLLDIGMARFSRHDWLRIVAATVVCGLLAVVTFGLVLRQSPLRISAALIDGVYPDGTVYGGIRWTPNLREVLLTFENRTSDDYEHLDIDVRFDSLRAHDASLWEVADSAAFILGAGQVTNVPGLTISAPSKFGEFVMNNGKGEKTILPSNHLQTSCRVRFDKFPRNDVVVLALAIDASKAKHLKTVHISGQYLANLRNHPITLDLPIGPVPLSPPPVRVPRR